MSKLQGAAVLCSRNTFAPRFLKTEWSFHSGLQHPLPGSSLSRNANNLSIAVIMAVLAGALRSAASLVRSIQHPEGLSAGFQGGAQALYNGDTVASDLKRGRFDGWNCCSRGVRIIDRDSKLKERLKNT